MAPDVHELVAALRAPRFRYRERRALDAALGATPAPEWHSPRVDADRPPTALRRRRPLGTALAVVVATVAVAAFVVTPLDLRTQAALAGAVFLVALALSRVRGHAGALVLLLLSTATTGRYLWWRLTTTVSAEPSVDMLLGALLLAAELYACTMLVLAYFQSMAALPRRPVPLPDDPTRWPSVDVLVPTYDEPLEVVRATVLAAQALDWPADRLRVYVLDDGKREVFRRFAAEAGVGYVVRPGNAHAKAGNLNHALSLTRGELVAIFDCDHVPVRSFLQVTAGGFLRDPRLAVVQTPHHFYSPDPFSRNLGTHGRVPAESELFYGVIQRGIDTWNASFFCGSCALLRRAALADVGGIAVDTVTEDAHTALRMHRRGWRTAYLDVPQAAGLSTETLAAHVGQRVRWARGMAQIFRVDNPLLGPGLRLGQRLSYLAAMLHFFSGIPRLVFLLVPVAYLVFERHVFNALPIAAVAYGLPHLAHSTVANARLHGRFRHSFWSEVYETCLAPYIALPTALALVAPRLGKFNVTAKGGRVDAPFFDVRVARPYLLLAAVNLVALGAAAWRVSTGAARMDALAINVAWTLHNLVILAATIAAACERRQRRASPRVEASVGVALRLRSLRLVLRGTTEDLSRGGARIAAPGAPPLAPGERVAVSLLAFPGDRRPIPAEVVGQGRGVLRVRFAPATLEDEGRVVRATFSRADAWIGRAERTPRDRPLRALGAIAWRGLAGVAWTLVLPWRRPAPPRHVPPPRPVPALSRGRS